MKHLTLNVSMHAVTSDHKKGQNRMKGRSAIQV